MEPSVLGSEAPTTQSALIERLASARRLTDSLFDLVHPDSLYDRPIPERHRIVFYIGHLEAFDWNLLAGRALHPTFDRLFAFGIDPVGGNLPDDTASDWPAMEEIRRYCASVRERLDASLEDCDTTLLTVAVEHRLMHAETLAYMLHQLPYDRKRPHALDPQPPARPIEPRMVEIPAGTATLGQPRENGHFGWDNEFNEHNVHVPAFAIDAYNITNGQFLEFFRCGGYGDRTLWHEDDWNWKERAGLHHPHFWIRRGNRWFYRAMFAEIPLPENWPVYVSHAEAAAYARWVEKDLPTEAQIHRALLVPLFHCSTVPLFPMRWDPLPADAFGPAKLAANGWEWTSTIFGPFPGFEPFPFYPGYSADFFDGKHYVLKGGSPRTTGCLLRPSFRNWFQPHYPYVYATFRCVKNG